MLTRTLGGVRVVWNRTLAERHRLYHAEGKSLSYAASDAALTVMNAAAAVDHPDELVRTALYPVVGEATLRDLVAQARADERAFSTRVRVQLRSCYSHHYRRGLPKLLKALRFRCNNTAHKPVMDALDLLERYDGSAEKSYAAGDVVPLDHVVPDDWRPAVVDERGRVERIPYELCALVALRAANPAPGDLGGRRQPVAQPRR